MCNWVRSVIFVSHGGVGSGLKQAFIRWMLPRVLGRGRGAAAQVLQQRGEMVRQGA
jgi:hypothetical protein